MDLEKPKTPTRFSYDNCIVRERSDSESFSEASFTLGLNDYTTSEGPQTSYHQSSSSTDGDSDVASVKLSLDDCYVLMVGFLRRIEVYLNESTPQDEEKRKLLEQSVLIKEALMDNREHFGVSYRANQSTVASVSHNATADNDASVPTGVLKDTSIPLPKTKTKKNRYSLRLQNLANHKKNGQITSVVPLDGTAANGVINNIEKISVAKRCSSFKNVKNTSTPLPKTKIEKTRFSRRLQNQANLKDSQTVVTSISRNVTTSNDHINSIEETSATTARRSSFRKAKKISTPVPKASKMNSDTANNNNHLKVAVSRKRSASSLNSQSVPGKRAKYVVHDARLARIQAKLQETINSFQKSSGSSESEDTEESPRKAKARNICKNLDNVKVQLNGEGTSRTRNKSLPNGFNIAQRKSPHRAKNSDKVSKIQAESSKVGDKTTGSSESKTTKKSREKATNSKGLGTINTEKNQRQLNGEGTNGTRKKGLSKSLNIADKKSSKNGIKMTAGKSNLTVVTDDEVNQSQSDVSGGNLSTSRVSMKRKLYSAESWLQTLSETMP